MTSLAEKLKDFNNTLTYYEVVVVSNPEDATPIIGEDGQYTTTRSGYAVVNTFTRVREHTSTLLPGVLMQATHLDNMVEANFKVAKQGDFNYEIPVEDVMVN